MTKIEDLIEAIKQLEVKYEIRYIHEDWCEVDEATFNNHRNKQNGVIGLRKIIVLEEI